MKKLLILILLLNILAPINSYSANTSETSAIKVAKSKKIKKVKKSKKLKKYKSNVYFKNCKEAKANGYSNIRKGEPGYSRRLDRDGDGVACETR
ncbi:excalibur calcium-binding domain-containing protein [Streptobacillus moniliformis]|uniref:excalibur calcium-binding domain-containing protein n=1 Tax=Streptobacillus moniliformis TaxID=34105 RepID=UPI0007E422EC|nr:excalibur calcium-binding domain-containing protein [Streptobacillus moniliformis]QXW65622.1 excalibur calcium-binding domain-containing protein [Streptobacillus moniliformis]